MQLQVLHIEKRIAIADGLNRHITRQQFETVGETRIVSTWVPVNADSEKTKDNVELVSREYTDSDGAKYNLSLQQAVDKRLSDVRIKPRKGQATCLEIILSGSHDRMIGMDRKELIDWAQKSVNWLIDIFGKGNVVSASLHVDETTPHIHAIVVPLVTGQSRRSRIYQLNTSHKTYNINHSKLRLCANEVFTRKLLYHYHDSYAEKVGKQFGLSRGIMAVPGSKKKHTTSIEHNRQLAVQEAELEKLIEEFQEDYDEKAEQIKQLQAEIEELKSEKEKHKKNVRAKVLKVIGKGGIAEAEKARDDAIRRAQEAESRADAADKARETAEEDATEAKRLRESFGNNEYERGIKTGKEKGILIKEREVEELKDKLRKEKEEKERACEREDEIKKEFEEMFRVNPNMKNWRQSVEVMRKAGMPENQVKMVFTKSRLSGVVIKYKCNCKEYSAEATVELLLSNKGKMGVWFDKKPYDKFISICKQNLPEIEYVEDSIRNILSEELRWPPEDIALKTTWQAGKYATCLVRNNTYYFINDDGSIFGLRDGNHYPLLYADGKPIVISRVAELKKMMNRRDELDPDNKVRTSDKRQNNNKKQIIL